MHKYTHTRTHTHTHTHAHTQARICAHAHLVDEVRNDVLPAAAYGAMEWTVVSARLRCQKIRHLRNQNAMHAAAACVRPQHTNARSDVYQATRMNAVSAHVSITHAHTPIKNAFGMWASCSQVRIMWVTCGCTTQRNADPTCMVVGNCMWRKEGAMLTTRARCKAQWAGH
jgi:hypothetical protein